MYALVHKAAFPRLEQNKKEGGVTEIRELKSVRGGNFCNSKACIVFNKFRSSNLFVKTT